MITDDDRRKMVLQTEAGAMTMFAHNERDHAEAFAVCTLDGTVNAMIRVLGAQRTAEIAYGVADRVVGGLRGPTEAPFLVIDQVAAAPTPTPPRPHREWFPKLSSRWEYWAVYFVGVAAGFLIGRLG